MKVISKLYFIYCLIYSELSLCDSLVWCGVTVLGVYSTLVFVRIYGSNSSDCCWIQVLMLSLCLPSGQVTHSTVLVIVGHGLLSSIVGRTWHSGRSYYACREDPPLVSVAGYRVLAPQLPCCRPRTLLEALSHLQCQLVIVDI